MRVEAFGFRERDHGRTEPLERVAVDVDDVNGFREVVSGQRARADPCVGRTCDGPAT